MGWHQPRLSRLRQPNRCRIGWLSSDGRSATLSVSLTDEQLLAEAPSQPHDRAAVLRRAIVLQALGYDDCALPLLVRALALDYTDPNAWLQSMIALSMCGRTYEAEQAQTALRELKPMQSAMWFTAEDREPLRPYVRLVHEAFMAAASASADPRRIGDELTALIEDYGDEELLRVQYTVSIAAQFLAQYSIDTNPAEPEKALRLLDDVVSRMAEYSDGRATFATANALLTRGSLLAQVGRTDEALATWRQVQDIHPSTGEGISPRVHMLIEQAMTNLAWQLLRSGRAEEGAETIEELARRYQGSPEPELRLKAAQSMLGYGAVDAVAEGFRGDADPAVARVAAEAELSRFLRRHPRLNRAPARWFIRVGWGLAVAARHRPPQGIVDPDAARSATRRRLGTTLRAVGVVLSSGAALASVVLLVRVPQSEEAPTTSLPLLACAAVVLAGQLAYSAGLRVMGRYSVATLAIAPRRLPRTALRAAFVLLAGWIAPAIERLGLSITYGPIRGSYGWLRDVGSPAWLAVIVMIVVAPIELLLVTYICTALLGPFRSLLGADNPLVKGLAEALPRIVVDEDEE
jgi:tetratricopeptide (TPR) repeat protein